MIRKAKMKKNSHKVINFVAIFLHFCTFALKDAKKRLFGCVEATFVLYNPLVSYKNIQIVSDNRKVCNYDRLSNIACTKAVTLLISCSLHRVNNRIRAVSPLWHGSARVLVLPQSALLGGWGWGGNPADIKRLR